MTEAEKHRAFGIWVFGLLAAAIIGGLLGGFAGVLAGMAAFTCLRMLLTKAD